MKTFHQWLEERNLNEKAARTSLGPYPRLYGPAGTHPPLWSAPVAADAMSKLKRFHPDVIKDVKKK